MKVEESNDWKSLYEFHFLDRIDEKDISRRKIAYYHLFTTYDDENQTTIITFPYSQLKRLTCDYIWLTYFYNTISFQNIEELWLNNIYRRNIDDIQWYVLFRGMKKIKKITINYGHVNKKRLGTTEKDAKQIRDEIQQIFPKLYVTIESLQNII